MAIPLSIVTPNYIVPSKAGLMYISKDQPLIHALQMLIGSYTQNWGNEQNSMVYPE